MIQTDLHQASALVAAYYDQNTARFLRLGGSRDTAAIHRAIWAEGVQDTAQAFAYLNQAVAGAITPVLPAVGPARLLDLGCGVGGTATWLAGRLPVHIVGVTNSAVQRQAAAGRAARLGLAGRCDFRLADFMDLAALDPDGTGSLFHAAYAIESFVHAADAARFFRQVARLLAPGGRLVICDDFLSPAGAASRAGSPSAGWLERFRRDWHIHNLLSVTRANELAQQAGFSLIESRDLTPAIHSFHPWLLYAVTTLTRLPLRWAYWQNLSGGTALQVCIRRGWTQYHTLVWQKLSVNPRGL